MCCFGDVIPKSVGSPGQCHIISHSCPACTGSANNLINETSEDVLYLEIGDRTPGDEVVYPDDDIRASLVNGKRDFTHKDGSPYG